MCINRRLVSVTSSPQNVAQSHQTWGMSKMYGQWQMILCTLESLIYTSSNRQQILDIVAFDFSIENDYVMMNSHNIAAGIHRHYIKKPSEFERMVKLCPEFNLTAHRIKYWDYKKRFWEESK